MPMTHTPASVATPGVTPGGVLDLASGSVTFSDASAGGFSVPLSSTITPSRIILNQGAALTNTVFSGLCLDATQLPSTVNIVVQGDAGGTVEVQMTALASGSVSGTIISNTLGVGETAILSVFGIE